MAKAIYGSRDRTVRDAVQPPDKFDYIDKQLAVADAAEQLWDVDRTVMEEARVVELVTDLDVLLLLDGMTGDLTQGSAFRLLADETWSPPVGIVLTSVRFKNALAGQRPTVRGVVLGV